jgi:ankyrin repeat protein
MKQGEKALSLFFACEKDSIEKVKYLIETCLIDPVSVEIMKQKSLLHVALKNRKGGRRIIEYLIEKVHLNINARDQNGRTLLHLVCSPTHTRNLSMAKYLISRGGNVWLQDHDQNTAVHTAMDKKNVSIISWILENPNAPWSTLTDFLACAGGKLEGMNELVTLILEYFKPDLDVQNKKGQTLLHLASKKNLKVLIRQLIQKGARLDLCDKKGQDCKTIIQEKNSFRRFRQQLIEDRLVPKDTWTEDSDKRKSESLFRSRVTQSDSGSDYSDCSSEESDEDSEEEEEDEDEEWESPAEKRRRLWFKGYY